MIKNLNLIIVVVLRLAGLYFVASGMFAWVGGILLTSTRGGIGLPFLVFMLPVVKGIFYG